MERFLVKIHLVVSGNGTTSYGVRIFDSSVNHILGLTYQGISGNTDVINRFLELEAQRIIYTMYGEDVEIINIDTKEQIQ